MIYYGIIIIIIIIVVFLIIHGVHTNTLLTNFSNCQFPSPSVSALENTNKIIWSYWHTNERPLTVNLAINTWYKHNPNYLICILSADTVNKYLDINILPKNYNKVSLQRKSDIIRLALLEKYSGVWLDASLFVSQSLDLLWDSDKEDYEVGGYYAEFFTSDKKHPVLESWFIAAPKNSKLIKAWKDEFYKGVDSDNYDLYTEEMEKTVNLQNIDGKVYLMIHCCFLKVISKGSWKWKMFPAGKNNGPLSYIVKNNWNIATAVLYLLTSEDPLPPIVKLRGGERMIINWLIYYMKNKSMMHQLIVN